MSLEVWEGWIGVVSSYRFSKLLQDLQVELKEEAESQRAPELHLPSWSRGREFQLVQEHLIGPAQGLLIPGSERNKVKEGGEKKNIRKGENKETTKRETVYTKIDKNCI